LLTLPRLQLPTTAVNITTSTVANISPTTSLPPTDHHSKPASQLLVFTVVGPAIMSIPPNILICGTPGTGKSTLAHELCSLQPGMRYVNVSDLTKERRLHDGEYDVERDTLVLDEDKVSMLTWDLLPPFCCSLGTFLGK